MVLGVSSCRLFLVECHQKQVQLVSKWVWSSRCSDDSPLSMETYVPNFCYPKAREV